MDQETFDRQLSVICTNPRNEEILEFIDVLHRQCKTCEIRDYEWYMTKDDKTISPLFISFWVALKWCWRCIARSGAEEFDSLRKLEWTILDSWYYLVSLPEFKNEIAAGEAFVDEWVVQTAFARLVNLCTHPKPDVHSSSRKFKLLLHWIYEQRVDLRSVLRYGLVQHLMCVSPDTNSRPAAATAAAAGGAASCSRSSGEIAAAASSFRSSGPLQHQQWVQHATNNSSDAGKSRAHLAPLLDILFSIIAGFNNNNNNFKHSSSGKNRTATSSNHTSSSDGRKEEVDEEEEEDLNRDEVLLDLLLNVLMPLHAPNEMVEWRDQIPVLQTYHEKLVRCVIKLINVQRNSGSGRNKLSVSAATTTDNVNDKSRNLLVQAVESLLSMWPRAFHTNTPKQVLFLHELEMLVEIANREEVKFFVDPLLNLLVRCFGTDSDNIRPAQRALKYFKNNKVVQILFGRPENDHTIAAATLLSDDSKLVDEKARATSGADDAIVTASGGSSIYGHVGESEKSYTITALRTVLPALFRGGQMSWNPTVNKMTGLALSALRDINPPVYAQCATTILFRLKSNPPPSFAAQRKPPTSKYLHSQTQKEQQQQHRADLVGDHAMGVNKRKVGDGGKANGSSKGEEDAKWTFGDDADADSAAFSTYAADAKSSGGGSSGSSTSTRNMLPPTTRLPSAMMMPPSSIGASNKALPPTRSAAGAAAAAAANISAGITTVRPPQQATVPMNLIKQKYDSKNPPPVTVTGIAPWARKNGPSGLPDTIASTSSSNGSSSNGGNSSSSPMTTIPGIRILGGSISGNGLNSTTTPGSSGGHHPSVVGASRPLGMTRQENARYLEAQQQQAACNVPAPILSPEEQIREDKRSAVEALDQYIKRCVPETSSSAEEARLNWNMVQAAFTPTLLPDLKFHDLVFGQVLGEGTFSTVKYCRHINRQTTQSHWSEYAVKVIKASKIVEHGYMPSVMREMAVLHVLSHPGICRLISAFRYKDSAYLLLEYASRGDLHGYLVLGGKLSHLHTRFILGELVAALSSLHDLGFSFNDLKPENILITQLGHIKLADFGGCRAQTDEARALLHKSSAILTSMRNGDWKEEPSIKPVLIDGEEGKSFLDVIVESNTTLNGGSASGGGSSSTSSSSSGGSGGDGGTCTSSGGGGDEIDWRDERLEGTPAYLPPELLLSQAKVAGKHTSHLSSFSSDSWALGCIAMFCIEGRPMYYGDAEEVLAQMRQQKTDSRAVHFNSRNMIASDRKPASSSSSDNNGSDSGPDSQIGIYDDNNNNDNSAKASAVDTAQQRALKDFVDKLMHQDPAQRCSIRESASHKYLTHGVIDSDLEIIETNNSSNTSSCTEDWSPPPVLSPFALHACTDTETTLPVRSARHGGSGSDIDSPWARRQFSVLWAPMPADYSLDDGGAEEHLTESLKGGGGGSGGGMHSSAAADVWLMTHARQLAPVIETAVERSAKFSLLQ